MRSTTSRLDVIVNLLPDVNLVDPPSVEEHTHRAETRPNAIPRHVGTILEMHDAVDTKPHRIVSEEPAVAQISIEAFVVGGIQLVSRKSHQ